MEPDQKYNSLTLDFIHHIRWGNVSDFDLIKAVKEMTNDYDDELLQALSNDISFYLFYEKEEMISKYSVEQIEEAINRRLEAGLDIPYVKNTKFEDLKDTGKAHALKVHGSAKAYDEREAILDNEALLYPFEFDNVYRLQHKVQEKLQDKNEVKVSDNAMVPTLKQDKVELHNDIFKEDGIKIWKYMFDDLGVKSNSRADITFMYQIMKYHGHIHSSVREADIINFLNKVHKIDIDRLDTRMTINNTKPHRQSSYKRAIERL